jgi:hypothetical protein
MYRPRRLQQASALKGLRQTTAITATTVKADDAPLTAAQMRQIRKRAPQGKKRSVRSSLFEVAPA